MSRAKNPDVVEVTLQMSSATKDALLELASITNRRGKSRLGRVTQDALRVYEWIIRQQSLGKMIAALEQPEVDLLTTTKDPKISGERDALAPMFSPRRKSTVRSYFESRS